MRSAFTFLVFGVGAWLLCPSSARAQDPTVLPSAPVFTLDVKSFDTKGTISYDKPFLLVLTGLDATVKTLIQKFMKAAPPQGDW